MKRKNSICDFILSDTKTVRLSKTAAKTRASKSLLFMEILWFCTTVKILLSYCYDRMLGQWYVP